jgi:hypothetical protein
VVCWEWCPGRWSLSIQRHPLPQTLVLGQTATQCSQPESDPNTGLSLHAGEWVGMPASQRCTQPPRHCLVWNFLFALARWLSLAVGTQGVHCDAFQETVPKDKSGKLRQHPINTSREVSDPSAHSTQYQQGFEPRRSNVLANKGWWDAVLP